MTMKCDTLAVGSLEREHLNAMWALFDEHYVGISREVFESDLSQKQKALLLWRNHKLIGFTSQRFCDIDSHRVIYSGDVIIDPDARDMGTAHFFQRWAEGVWKHCDWWCALSSGPRTFRIPFTFFNRVTPQPGSSETDKERILRHLFAQNAYGSQYCPDTGIVTLANAYQLRDPVCKMRQDYPMGAYFEQLNPGWLQGDELVSLVSLDISNWKPIAKRMLNWKNLDG